MFKAATIFQFPTGMDFSLLEDQCASCSVREPGPQELGTVGFLRSPLGMYVERTDDGSLALTVQYQDRLLPSDAVNREITKRIKAIEDTEGRTPGGRMRRQLKEDVILEMLPHAFIRSRNVNVILNPERGLCFVSTPARKLAEGTVGQLRYAMGSFPALPLNAEISVPSVLVTIATDAHEGRGYTIYNELEATDTLLWLEGSSKETAKLKEVELTSEEVAKHLEFGMLPVRMSMMYGAFLTFVFGNDLVLRSMKIIDEDAVGDRLGEQDTAEDVWRARTALDAWLLAKVYDALAEVFKFSAPPIPLVDKPASLPKDLPSLDAEDLA